MKMKNEDAKNEDFLCLTKIFHYILSETLNFADLKYVFRFFIYFSHQKLQPFKAGPFCLFLATFSLL